MLACLSSVRLLFFDITVNPRQYSSSIMTGGQVMVKIHHQTDALIMTHSDSYHSGNVGSFCRGTVNIEADEYR